MAARKQKQTRKGQSTNTPFKGPAPNYLSSMRVHLLKVLPPPNSGTGGGGAGNEVFNTWLLLLKRTKPTERPTSITLNCAFHRFYLVLGENIWLVSCIVAYLKNKGKDSTGFSRVFYRDIIGNQKTAFPSKQRVLLLTGTVKD
jgi:hypothetical protein